MSVMEQKVLSAVSQVLSILVVARARSATKYLSSSLVVRATRPLFKHNGKKIDNRSNLAVVLTIGKPNYLECDFIADCKKAGEPFPVKKVQIKFPPKPKPKRKAKRK